MSLESLFQTLKNSDALNNLPLALKKDFSVFKQAQLSGV